MNNIKISSMDTEIMEKILLKIVENNQLHAMWLNLLSYLEFIGSRKIFKTQKNGYINESVLKHASDEARHALVLKQMIDKINKNDNYKIYNTTYMLAAYSGYRYIQNLDSMVKKRFFLSEPQDFEKSYLCYVYMSYVIEVRANWLYKIYSRILGQINSEINLTGIQNDEIRHLDEMEREIKQLDSHSEVNIKLFMEKEAVYFNRFLRNLQKKI